VDRLKTYFDTLIHSIRLSSWVIQEELSFMRIDENSAYIKGELYLNTGFVLHMAEFVSLQNEQLIREKYRYHLQDAHQRRIARWDNAPHYPGVRTFPNHRHGSDDRVEASEPMTLPLVLENLETILKDI